MPASLEPILPHIPAFALVMFRLTGLFIFAPLLGSTAIPARVKALLTLVLAFCVYPMIPPQVPVELSVWSVATAVGAELLIGLVIGYGASLPLMAVQMGGLMMGQQLGLALAEVFNPEIGDQSNPLSEFLFVMAVTVFVLLDGHHAMLTVLVGSFQTVPLGGYAPGHGLLQVVVGLLSAMFELGIRVAAPLLCLVFLETVAMGFVARTVPQLNILSLGFPLRIVLGLGLLVAVVASMNEAVMRFIVESMGALARLFGV